MRTFIAIGVLGVTLIAITQMVYNPFPRLSKYEEDDFKTLLLGKHQPTIKNILGSPKATLRVENKPMWLYSDLTYDSERDIDHDSAIITFDTNGQAIDISFQDSAPQLESK